MNRYILDKLREAGYTKQVNESLRAFLTSQGYTGQLNKAFYNYLGSLGHTNTLSERIKAFQVAGEDFSGVDVAQLLRDNADVYIDKDTEFTGPASAITALQPDGSLGQSLTAFGAGTQPAMGTDGLTITAGPYLWNNWTGSYDAAFTCVKFKRNASPSSGAGDIMRLNGAGGHQHYIRYVAANSQTMAVNNTIVDFVATDVSNGDTQTVLLMTDSVNDIARSIDHTGYVYDDAANVEASPVSLGQVRLGERCNVTIEMMAIFLKPVGGSFAMTPEEVWALMSGKTIQTVSGTDIIYMGNEGQSLTIGRNPSDNIEKEIAVANGQEFVKAMSGLVTTGAAAVPLHGPQAVAIDTAVAATGLIPARASVNLPPAYLAAATMNLHRADYGLTPQRYFVQNTGVAGVSINEMDSDTGTGTTSTDIIDNYTYVINQMKAQAAAHVDKQGVSEPLTFKIPNMTILQGSADKSWARGAWQTRAQIVFNEYKAIAFAETGVNPRLAVWQTPGDLDTTQVGENFYVKDDQVRLVLANSGTIIAPLDQIEHDPDAHPSEDGYKMMGELQGWHDAFVEAEVAAGRDGTLWNLIPSVTRDGTTLTVAITGMTGETLVAEDLYYSGAGYSDLGFEAIGANITGTTVNDNSVVITCDGVPTALRYQMQQQVVTGTRHAHRGILRGSVTKTPKVHPVGTLYRWVSPFWVTV